MAHTTRVFPLMLLTYALAHALLLGLIGGAIPGPVLTAIFTKILQSGFIKSFRIILWAMLTETVVALLSLVALSSLGLPEAVFRILSLIGTVILLWISASLWKVRHLDTKDSVRFSPWKISAMILANGVLWTFWITICVPQAIDLGRAIPFGNILFLILVEIGWLISTSAVAFIFSRFRTLLSHPSAVPFIFKFFSLTFLYFAIDMAYQSVRFFTR